MPGFSLPYSHSLKKSSSCAGLLPLSDFHRSMNWRVDALPYWCAARYVFSTALNLSSPTISRSASITIAPRVYMASVSKMSAAVGGAAGGVLQSFAGSASLESKRCWVVSGLLPLRSCHSHEKNSAGPSFSQMSDQVAGDTASPNHWWASSCDTVSRPGLGVLFTAYIGFVCVSSAYPTFDLSTTPPIAS